MEAEGTGAIPFSDDNGQEDRDFFENLANDLGNDGTEFYGGKDVSFNEAFSQLNIRSQGSGPSASVSGIAENITAADDFWLEENVLALDADDGFKAVGSTGISNIEGCACPPQESYFLQTKNAGIEIAPTNIKSIMAAELDTAPQTAHLVTNDGQCLSAGDVITMQNEDATFPSEPLDLGVDDKNQQFTLNHSQTLLDPDSQFVTDVVDSGIIGSLPSMQNKDATFPLEPLDLRVDDKNQKFVSDRSQTLLGLDSHIVTDSGMEASPPAMRNKDDNFPSEPLDVGVDDGDQKLALNHSQTLLGPDSHIVTDFLESGIVSSPPAMLNGFTEESVNADPGQSQYMRESAGISPEPSVKELQWSNFGDAFQNNSHGSYSDFFSELANEKVSTSNCETHTNTREMKSEISTFYSREGFTVLSDNQTNDFSGYNAAEYSNQNYRVDSIDGDNRYAHITADSAMTEQVAAVKGFQETMYDNDSSFTNTLGSGVSEPGAASNYETQQQYQSWENMYPGWYFDHTTNTWKECSSVTADQSLANSSFSFEGINSLHAQSGIINQATGLPESSSHMIEKPNSWSVAGQGLGMDTQVSSNDQYVSYGGLADQQNANNWENQYPGWYYDAMAQEWRQTSGDTALHEEYKKDDFQATNSSFSSPHLSNSWTEEHSQSYYQGNVNQNVYWNGMSQSAYSNGTEATRISRGISFNSWTEPITEMGDTNSSSNLNVENAIQDFPNMNAGVWDGFQVNRSYSYETQATYNVGNQATVSGVQSGVFQPYSAPTSHMSAGRPSHPLAVFGFGGKLVVMKPSQIGIPEHIVFHDLSQLVLTAETHSYNDGITYFSALKCQGLPCPLDGHGSSSKELTKWMDDRKEKCQYEDRQNTNIESLRVLWGVLKTACLHYGKLRPLAGLISQDECRRPEAAIGKLLPAANSQEQLVLAANQCSKALYSLPTEDQLQATAHEVRMNLMDGKQKEALHLAQEGQLWGLALVLASKLGEKVFSDTVFRMAQQQFSPGSPLRTLLLLLAGQSTELFSSEGIASSVGTSSPYILGSSISKDNAGGMLSDWLGNLSIIAANPTKGDEHVICHLGDSLWKDQGEVTGAHVCYLVADRNVEYFSEEARLCLIGADHFKYRRTFATPLAIQRTELFMYAKVLGNPQYVQIPFQPYKLLYAHMLAEAGKLTEASRYCQDVKKALKSAPDAPQIDFCKKSAFALEERLRLHRQGGYSLNFSTGKLVGKVMGTIDSTIHKIIGGPPVTTTSQLYPNSDNIGDWNLIDQKYSSMGTPVNTKNDQKYGYTGTPPKAVPLVPSHSINSLANNNDNGHVDMGAKSLSAPNLSRSLAQEVQKSKNNQEMSSVSPKKPKPKSSAGGYFGRFGVQIIETAVRMIKHNNKEAKLGDENKFYYDEKLKRWVEAGVEQSQDEVPLAPPPMASNFTSSFGAAPSPDAKSSEESQGPSLNASTSSDLPPIPPAANQFSARARMQGVRARYVDTFNKGNTPSPMKSTGSPIVPVGTWGKASTPSQFFSSMDNTEKLANGFIHDGNSLLPNMSFSLHGDQADHEPLLPKDLSSSFMAMPPTERRSSVNDLSMLSGNEVVNKEKSDAFTPSASLNMARTVSWSGDTSTSAQNFISSVSSEGASQNLNGIGQFRQMDASSTPGLSSFLPSPPVIASHTGFGSGVPLSTGSHGGIFGEMQEVEL